MSGNQQNIELTGNSVPQSEQTVSLDFANQEPEIIDNPEDQQQEEKKFTQAEIDAIISKRLAKEQRKWERERTRETSKYVSQTQVAHDNLSVDQFESPEAYAEALAERKAQELVEKRERERKAAEIMETYHDKEEELRNKYDDFDQVVYNPSLTITNVMAETIKESDVGPEVAYYLGSNPKEAARISRLSPFLQAKEIGKIEVKLTENPPTKKVSSAPAPITPITVKTSGNVSYDTTDPRSVKAMSTSEWIEAERQRQIKKLQSQR